MKYLEGMLPPCLVCAELGKISLVGRHLRRPLFPRASADWRCDSHFSRRPHASTMSLRRWRLLAELARQIQAALDNIVTQPPFEVSQDVARRSMPKMHSAMCAYSHGFSRKGVPILIKTIPRIAPTAREIQPSAPGETLGGSSGKGKRGEESLGRFRALHETNPQQSKNRGRGISVEVNGAEPQRHEDSR